MWWRLDVAFFYKGNSVELTRLHCEQEAKKKSLEGSSNVLVLYALNGKK